MSKDLTDIVNELKFVKGWTVEQVAQSIGYSRVHLQKEMKKKEGNEMIKMKLLNAHRLALQNVAQKDTTKPAARDPADVKDKYISLLEKQNEATLEDLKTNLNTLKSELLDQLGANRMLLQEIYLWVEEQRNEGQASPKAPLKDGQKGKKSMDGSSNEGKPKDGTYSRNSKGDS